MSARSFTIRLLRPAVEVVVVVHGLVRHRRPDSSDEGVGGVFSEGRSASFDFSTTQVLIHRLAHDRCDACASPGGLIPQLPIGFVRETQVRDDISRHGDITISARQIGGQAPAPKRAELRAGQPRIPRPAGQGPRRDQAACRGKGSLALQFGAFHGGRPMRRTRSANRGSERRGSNLGSTLSHGIYQFRSS